MSDNSISKLSHSGLTSRPSLGRSRFISRAAIVVLACIALVAAACGSDGDDDVADPGPTTAPTTTQAEASDAPTTSADEAPEEETDLANPDVELEEATEGDVETVAAECPVFEDERGGIFQEYQNEFDRCHPFQPLDTFCTPHATAAIAREATDTGISEDSITIVHLRTQLEDLASIGFATDVGDPTKMFNTFAWFVNNMCGGVNGRTIDLQLVETPASGSNIDELRNAACIEATEDLDAVVVINSTGFQGSANLCLVEDHETAFISAGGQSGEFMDRGEGRLVTLSPTLEESLAFLVETLLASGELDGQRIGIIAPDTPGQVEAVERGLRTPLEEAGLDVAVFDVIGCGGQVTCSEGNSDSVSRMIDEGVDVMFPTLNVVSLPQYLS